MLWCHSHLVWLVFEASILQKTFCDLFLLFFFLFVLSFTNDKREERWEGKTHGQHFCSHKLTIIINQMLPSEFVKPCITLLYLRGFRAYKSPTHFMWTTIRFTEKLSVDCHHKGHIALSRKTTLQQKFAGQ